jgi:carbohydrate diacid regulator
VIDTGKKNNDVAMELVKNLADMRSGDFVTSVDQHSIVLVKDISHIAEKEQEETLTALASSLADNLHMEAMIRVRVGYGNVVQHLPDIVQSYQEAKMALEVGRVFYAQRDTISYGRLGIGRLIYQLPMSLCHMFIKEVFGEQIPEILEDEEAMSTIHKFFENNLNISETARQLYVHRNTLVYRLERIEKAIGLDIRTFDDAMTFRIAVMVIAHMKDSEQAKQGE